MAGTPTTLDQLPDGRYFDGTYEWEKEGEDWTPLLAPFGMPPTPRLEGLRRVVTTFEPVEVAVEPEEPTVVLPTPEDIDAFADAWQKHHDSGARSGRDRYGIAAVLALRDLKPHQLDGQAFNDGAGVFREDDESWIEGGLRVLLTRRLGKQPATRRTTAADRLANARQHMTFLRERAPHDIAWDDDIVIASAEVYRLHAEAEQCRRDRNAAMADQDRLTGLLNARTTADLETIQNEVWKWFNRHGAPWSPSDTKVIELAISIRDELAKPTPTQG